MIDCKKKKYGISEELCEKIKERDKRCIYCDKEFKEYPYSDKATIEHMDTPSVKNPEEWRVGICCHSCNASRKGKNEDWDTWFESDFCKKRKINKDTVAQFVKDYRKRIQGEVKNDPVRNVRQE